jgi:quercetin dioxygenase-like cupin family protein
MGLTSHYDTVVSGKGQRTEEGTMPAVPVVAGKDDGEALWFGGGLFVFKVTSEQSGGAFLLIEDTMGKGKTTPLHVHPSHDETFYLVEGDVRLHIDGVESDAGAGAIASIPRGIPHAFLVTSEFARVIVMVTPGDASFEAFYREGGEPAKTRTMPTSTELDIPKLVEAGKRTGSMEVLGPPPFAK